MATAGRDPGSDLVLNDPKCSRRHAVIESGPDGVAIRDNGSANGVFVNGHKVERARIRDGDLIKLGDVLVTLLPEPIPGTMVMDELEELSATQVDTDLAAPVADAEPPTEDTAEAGLPPVIGPPASPRPRLGTGRTRPTVIEGAGPDADGPVEPLVDAGAQTFSPRPRPLTVTVLSTLWALSVPLYAVGGLLLSRQASGSASASLLAAGIGLAAFAAALAIGLWLERRPAYVAQVAVAGLGFFVCPFSLASIAVLVYMLRPDVRWRFSDRREREPAGAGQAETMFTGALLGAVLLGLILTAALTFLARTARTVAAARLFARAPAAERMAVAELKTMAAAQDAFRSVCNTGYGDLEALRRPATVVPDYPEAGPAFLRGSGFDQPVRDGYRFELDVEEEMPPAPGCPARRFRRYLYSAVPLGAGRSLAVGPDGVVRAARGRAAVLTDPPAE